MDITRRSDYACRILRAAFNNQNECISVTEIAEQEGIPYAFARSIQHDLVKSGLVKTIRGAHGGIALDCDPAKVTLLEVLESVQGPVSIATCVTDPEYCDKQPGCAYNRVWQGVDKIIQDYLSAITLEKLFKLGGSHPVIMEVMSDSVSLTDLVSESSS